MQAGKIVLISQIRSVNSVKKILLESDFYLLFPVHFPCYTELERKSE